MLQKDDLKQVVSELVEELVGKKSQLKRNCRGVNVFGFG